MFTPQVSIGPLRYRETVQLACCHLGCDELDPLVAVALYLRAKGSFSSCEHMKCSAGAYMLFHTAG